MEDFLLAACRTITSGDPNTNPFAIALAIKEKNDGDQQGGGGDNNNNNRNNREANRIDSEDYDGDKEDSSHEGEGRQVRGGGGGGVAQPPHAAANMIMTTRPASANRICCAPTKKQQYEDEGSLPLARVPTGRSAGSNSTIRTSNVTITTVPSIEVSDSGVAQENQQQQQQQEGQEQELLVPGAVNKMPNQVGNSLNIDSGLQHQQQPKQGEQFDQGYHMMMLLEEQQQQQQLQQLKKKKASSSSGTGGYDMKKISPHIIQLEEDKRATAAFFAVAHDYDVSQDYRSSPPTPPSPSPATTVKNIIKKKKKKEEKDIIPVVMTVDSNSSEEEVIIVEEDDGDDVAEEKYFTALADEYDLDDFVEDLESGQLRNQQTPSPPPPVASVIGKKKKQKKGATIMVGGYHNNAAATGSSAAADHHMEGSSNGIEVERTQSSTTTSTLTSSSASKNNSVKQQEAISQQVSTEGQKKKQQRNTTLFPVIPGSPNDSRPHHNTKQQGMQKDMEEEVAAPAPANGQQKQNKEPKAPSTTTHPSQDSGKGPNTAVLSSGQTTTNSPTLDEWGFPLFDHKTVNQDPDWSEEKSIHDMSSEFTAALNPFDNSNEEDQKVTTSNDKKPSSSNNNNSKPPLFLHGFVGSSNKNTTNDQQDSNRLDVTTTPNPNLIGSPQQDNKLVSLEEQRTAKCSELLQEHAEKLSANAKIPKRQRRQKYDKIVPKEVVVDSSATIPNKSPPASKLNGNKKDSEKQDAPTPFTSKKELLNTTGKGKQDSHVPPSRATPESSNPPTRKRESSNSQTGSEITTSNGVIQETSTGYEQQLPPSLNTKRAHLQNEQQNQTKKTSTRENVTKNHTQKHVVPKVITANKLNSIGQQGSSRSMTLPAIPESTDLPTTIEINTTKFNSRVQETSEGYEQELAIPTTPPVDPIIRVQKNQQEEKKVTNKMMFRIAFCLVVLLAVIIAFLLGVFVGNEPPNNDDGSASASASNPDPTVPTPSPSVPATTIIFPPVVASPSSEVASPINTPTTTKTTSAPTTVAPTPMSLMDKFRTTLPAYTLTSMSANGTQSSPQLLAFEWLFMQEDVNDMPLWRMTQLFALATFYYSLAGPFWPMGRDADWLDLSNGRTECDWYSKTYDIGVNEYTVLPCNERGEYQSLRLEGLDLSSHDDGDTSLPPEVELLTSLKEVEISDSGIGAVLEDWIPEQLYRIGGQLQMLNLEGNTLDGSVPTEFGHLSGLQLLSLSGNHLSGPIASELAMMTSLQGLYLNANSFSGMVPTELGSLSVLTDLHLGHNALLSSPIPSEIGLASKLKELHLMESAFAGSIPSQLGMLKELEQLKAHQNLLYGPIPSQLALMTSIRYLSLNSNHLTGSIPTELTQLTTTMRHFNVSENQLSGRVSSGLCMYGGATGSFFDCTHLLCGCHCICMNY